MKKSNLFLVILMALIVMSCSKDETTMSTAQESNAKPSDRIKKRCFVITIDFLK